MTVTTNKKSKKAYKIALIALVFAILGWILPGQTFTEATYINASDINAFGFSSDSGNNPHFMNLIDNSSWNGTEAPGASWEIFVTYENVSSFDYIESLIKYNSSTTSPSQHEVNMSIWCVTDNAYVEVEDMSVDLEYHYRSTKFINSSHFIIPASNGTVLLKFVHPTAGTAGHRFWIDLLRLVNEPQFEQIIVNNTISTGGSGGAGCTGNCSFDGVWLNSLRINTSPGTRINLSAEGFQNVDNIGGTQNRIDINNGNSVVLESLDYVSNLFSQIFVSSTNIRSVVTNGVASETNLYDNRYNINIDSHEYNFNATHMDYGGANITNLNNTNMTGKLIANISGPYISVLDDTDATAKFNTLYENNSIRSYLTIGGEQLWRFRTASNVEVGYLTYSTPNAYPGIVMYNETRENRSDIVNAPLGIEFGSELGNGSFSRAFRVTKTDNIAILKAGKGITMLSPDGNDWCVTVTNAGALTVSATPCT